MSRKFVYLVLAASVAFAGCKKLSQLHLPGKKTEETTVAATKGQNLPAPPPKPEVIATTSDVSAPAPASTPAAPAAVPGAAPAAAPTAAKPPIDPSASAIALCYHNIEDKGGIKALTITVAEFDRELKAIKDNGFTVIPMQDFLAWRRGEKNIPRKSCIITIDDGWVSAYTNAWPLLKKYGYPFTVFIYVNYVGSGGKSMSWDQLAEMRDAGVDIECHTYSHSDLKKPGVLVDKKTADLVRKDVATLGVDGWLKKEIVDSKEMIEKQLGIKVNAFAYPFGKYNQKARELVKAAGYEAAFTVYGQRLTHSSPYDLLGRYAVETDKPKIFEDAMAMIGGGVPASEAGPSTSVAQLAATSMVTEPQDGAVITNPTPKIKANLATMGEIEANSIALRVSGVGALPFQYNAESKILNAQIPQKLRPGSYEVIISAKVGGQKAETRWSFKYDPTGKATSPMDAPLLPPKVLGQ